MKYTREYALATIDPNGEVTVSPISALITMTGDEGRESAEAMIEQLDIGPITTGLFVVVSRDVTDWAPDPHDPRACPHLDGWRTMGTTPICTNCGKAFQ